MTNLSQEDKQELKTMMMAVVAEGYEQLISPRFDRLETRMDRLEARMDGQDAKTDQIQKTLDDHTFRLDRIERIVRAETERLDEHSVRLKKIEKHIGFK
jgi:uncharacterized coiled-coil protein SlyX